MTDDEIYDRAMLMLTAGRWRDADGTSQWLVVFGMCHAWNLVTRGDVSDDFDMLADVAMIRAFDKDATP